jgi:hypothetical protein
MVEANLDFNIGCVNPSGIATTIYAVNKKDIAGWPTISDDITNDETTAAQAAKYSGSFSLKTGKKFRKLYSTQGKGKATFEQLGERDSKMFKNKFSMSYPDLTPEGLAFCKEVCNGDCVIIVKSAGRYHVIGNPDYRTETTSTSGDTGDEAGSSKGIKLEAECPDTTPLPLYEGNITTDDGTLNCSTGEFTPAS